MVKFEEQEKQKFEQTRKQIETNLKQKNEKLIETTKAEMEKNFTEMKTKMVKELEKKNQDEIEKLKMRFVQEMKETKDKLQSEHNEVSSAFCCSNDMTPILLYRNVLSVINMTFRLP